MKEEKKNTFIIYKETYDNLREAKDDLRYYRHQLKKRVPNPNYEKEYDRLTKLIVDKNIYINNLELKLKEYERNGGNID